MARDLGAMIKRIAAGQNPVSGGNGQWPIEPGAPSVRGGPTGQKPMGQKLSLNMRKRKLDGGKKNTTNSDTMKYGGMIG